MDKPNPPKNQLQDPYAKTSLTRVNTSYYLGLIADRCSKMGIYQNADPIAYRSAVDQLEIFASGSNLLGSKYQNEKKGLINWRSTSIGSISKGFNPAIRKSGANERIQGNVDQVEKEFVRRLHKLLMKHLAPSFWEKTRFDTT
jgi:hypothetical protein